MKYETVETTTTSSSSYDGKVDDVEPNRKQREWTVGLVLLMIVVFIWTGSTYLVVEIYDRDFDAPYFLTLICNSLFVSYLPLYFCLRSQQQRHQNTSLVSISNDESIPETSVPWRTCVRAALIVSPLWFAANGCYNFSLKATSPSSNTILSSLSGLFTYLLSFCVLSETFDRRRFSGVLLSLLGAVLVGVADLGTGDGDEETAWGDIVCLLSAFFYASYTVAIRKCLPENETKGEQMLFFGLLGAINIIVFGTVGAFVWYVFRWEDLSELTWATFGMIVLKATFDNVLSDYLWARAVILTSPTVATIALTLTIPGPLIIDAVSKGVDESTPLRFGGGLAVIAGFVLVAIQRPSSSDAHALVPGRATTSAGDDHETSMAVMVPPVVADDPEEKRALVLEQGPSLVR